MPWSKKKATPHINEGKGATLVPSIESSSTAKRIAKINGDQVGCRPETGS